MGGTETKTVCQTVSNEVKYKNVEHVVQSTFQNTLITFKAQTYNFYIELSSKGILTKNLYLNSVCQKQNIKCSKIQKATIYTL